MFAKKMQPIRAIKFTFNCFVSTMFLPTICIVPALTLVHCRVTERNVIINTTIPSLSSNESSTAHCTHTDDYNQVEH